MWAEGTRQSWAHGEPILVTCPFLSKQRQAPLLEARQNPGLHLRFCLSRASGLESAAWTSSASVRALPPARPWLVLPQLQAVVLTCPWWRWPGVSSTLFLHSANRFWVLHWHLLSEGAWSLGLASELVATVAGDASVGRLLASSTREHHLISVFLHRTKWFQ